ncbi:MAG: LacI family transcriptional regulator [Firmicutes bacterium]|jgi:LacI family transcriptional regulator|nr:LacI family transcriptional regulator [Bacillota bacterium]
MNGDRPVTIIDVAKAAGVSRATAARALGGYGYVSERASKAVMEAAEKLNYRPNELARSMITGRTNTIGLVVADIRNPFFAGIAHAVDETLETYGYTFIVCSTSESLDREQKALELLSRRQVDGIILAPTSSNVGEHIASIAQKLPIVLIDRVVEGLRLDAVAVNNQEAAAEAVRRLIQAGHRQIGFLGGPSWLSSIRERYAGYTQALAEAGLKLDDRLIRWGSYSTEEGLYQALSLLKQKDRPTAVFTGYNELASSILMACRELAIRIPQDLSLVCFDHQEWLDFLTPPISSIAQPVGELGRVAAERLLSRINGDASPVETVRLPVTFCDRESIWPMAPAGEQLMAT